jgi:hypothetical protein
MSVIKLLIINNLCVLLTTCYSSSITQKNGLKQMSRRKTDSMNLSFLDVLTSGLGAIIFLFIIIPKGSDTVQTPVEVQAELYMDSISGSIWGMPDRPQKVYKKGDTLTIVLSDFKTLDTILNKDNNKLEGTINQQLLATIENLSREAATRKSNPMNNSLLNTPSVNVQIYDKRNSLDDSNYTNRTYIRPKTMVNQPIVYSNVSPKRDILLDSNLFLTQKDNKNGTLPEAKNVIRPANPCKVAFEIKWQNITDNVDLYVYKGNQFVCGKGGLRANKNIGEWDSGKSRNRLFGNDLRTNQEAVRQFAGIVPGEYKIFAQFKETLKPDSVQSINLTGLVYTNNEKGEEKSKAFNTSIPLSKKEKMFIGTVNLNADGTINFK